MGGERSRKKHYAAANSLLSAFEQHKALIASDSHIFCKWCPLRRQRPHLPPFLIPALLPFLPHPPVGCARVCVCVYSSSQNAFVCPGIKRVLQAVKGGGRGEEDGERGGKGGGSKVIILITFFPRICAISHALRGYCWRQVLLTTCEKVIAGRIMSQHTNYVGLGRGRVCHLCLLCVPSMTVDLGRRCIFFSRLWLYSMNGA